MKDLSYVAAMLRYVSGLLMRDIEMFMCHKQNFIIMNLKVEIPIFRRLILSCLTLCTWGIEKVAIHIIIKI